LKARCDGMGLQPRGTKGESGGQTGKFQKYSQLKNSIDHSFPKNIFLNFLTFRLNKNWTCIFYQGKFNP
jgi:hypothetical protein